MKTHSRSSSSESPDSRDEHSTDWISRPYALVFTGVLSFILIFGIAVFLGYRQNETTRHSALTADATTAGLLAKVIFEHHKATIGILQSYALRPGFIKAVKDTDQAEANKYLSDLKKNAEIDLTFITDKRGVVLSTFPLFSEVLGKDLSYRDWYQGVSSHWKPFVSTVFKLIVENEPLAVAICVPISEEMENIIGILATSQRLDFLANTIETVPLSPRTTVNVIDRAGQILYSNKLPYLENITKYSSLQYIEAAIRRGGQQIEINNAQNGVDNNNITFVAVGDIGWKVIVERSQRDIFESEFTNIVEIGAISLLLFVVVNFFSAYLKKVTLFRRTEELLRAEKAALNATKDWQTTFNAISSAIWILDSSQRILRANKAAEELCNKSNGRMLGRQCWQLAHGTDCPIDGCPLLKAKESLHRETMDLQLGDGWFQVTVDPILNAAGEFSGAIHIISDISERKGMEVALRESENTFRAMVEKIPLAIYLSVGIEQRATYVNPEFVKLFGYTLEDIPTVEQWWPLAYPDEHYRREISEKWNQKVQHAIETQLPIEPIDVVVTCKNGSKKNISWGYITLGDKNYAFGLDLTRRKKTERERERLLHILESSLNEIYVFDSVSLVFEYVNHAALHNLGYTHEAMLSGMTPVDLKPEFTETTFRQFVEPLLQGKQEVLFFETMHRRHDGSLYPVEVHLQLVKLDEDQKVFLAVILDLTKGKLIEKEKIRLESQLQQAQKMESVGRLAGGVAHDFNNMLSVILGYGQMVLDKTEPDDFLHECAQEIVGAGVRSANITRQLLAFARKQTIDPQIVDLNTTVEDTLKMLGRLIGEDINLTWQPGSVWPVKIDPSQLDQLLANICVNARDAISGVGKITIETETTVFDEAYCSEHPGFTPGQFVLLSISDDGCGMDKDVLNNLFEPFFTTKQLGKGTGLGLATVYGIVKQNNGFINVYSEPDKGTTFRIYLPRHSEQGNKPEELREETIQAGQGETVLVVEDEASILKLAARTLRDLGYTVLTANGPSEAVNLAQRGNEKIDLLITDVIMPEMNGRDLANVLLNIYPDLKCLFMSGYTSTVIANQGVLDEGVHFLQKPFSARDLAAKARKALAA